MELKKKYNLFTAIAMVSGIIIGSGVFFKAGNVLNATGGDLKKGILAWIIGGIVMIISAYTFSLLSRNRVTDAKGVFDYAKGTVGKKYGYYIGWYMAIIYYPILTGILAWVCGRYTAVLMGFSAGDAVCSTFTILMSMFYLAIIYAINCLAPIIAGKIQVSTTVIKLIPLAFVAIVGTIYGLFADTGMILENFSEVVVNTGGKGFFTAICATSFAYEGWIVATSISKELKNSNKNMPRALLFGSILVLLVYILYYVGLSGVYPNADFMNDSEGTVKLTFVKLLGNGGGYILFVFVIISCLGTLNGLMMGCIRGMHAVTSNDMGPRPSVYGAVDKGTDMPHNSCIIGFALCLCWYVFWLGNFMGWYGDLFIDISELPIILIYPAYIPIYIYMIAKCKELSKFNRFVVPIAAILCSILMVIACIYAHKISCLIFLAITGVGLLIGFLFNLKKKAITEVVNEEQPIE